VGRTKNENTAIARRRATVADLYVQGWMQSEIAGQIGVSQPTVSMDIKAIQKEWRESEVRDFDILRERELQKLDRLEREAWEAWERSQKPVQETLFNTNGSEQKSVKKLGEQTGDPRFLEQIHKCIASRRALLGLDAPTRIAPTSPDGKEAYHSHVMSELMKLAEQSHIGPQVIDGAFIEHELQQPPVGPEQTTTYVASSNSDGGQTSEMDAA
jgi:predicted transcriptional regulator